MRNKCILILILFPLLCLSQNTSQLNSSIRAKVVSNISELLLNNYVFPDTAVKMSECIQRNLKKGAYNKISDAVDFSDALTKDLYSVYHDGHMLVQYVPGEVHNNRPDTSRAEPASNPDPFLRIKQDNFGLKKLEILNGNIGYLKMDHFWADSMYGKETVKASLQFLRNTKALIIDLRDCGGGSQESVKIICSYFFEKPTHINDMFDRTTNTTTEYWTLPDSTFTAMTQMPLYLLVNDKTFSAAEEFCYDLQCLKRTTLIGQTTGGGAHGTFTRDAGNGFVLSIPYSTAINPITKTSWEKVGVKPDVDVASEKALETAEVLIFDKLIANTVNASELFSLKWDLELLKAINNPVILDTLILKQYAGVYGERTFTYDKGKLYYQRTGRPKFELEAMSQNMMKAKGNQYFKIEFIKNGKGIVDTVKAYYQDNRIEISTRIK